METKQWLNWARMIDSLQDDLCSSFWIKAQAKELNKRDVVDVLNDLQLLTRIFDAKFESLNR